MPRKLDRISGDGGVERRRERVERGAELVGVDALGGLGEVAEDADDVVGGVGARQRDGVVGVHLAGAGRAQLEVLLPQQVEHLDGGAAVGAELEAVVDPELDDHLVAGELDVLDAAGPEAGDLHHVALAQAAGVAELGPVGLAAEAGELREVERGGHHQEEHHEGDRSQAHDLPVGVAAHQLHLAAVLWKARLLQLALELLDAGTLRAGSVMLPLKSQR